MVYKGDEIFKMVDTYGLPLDIIVLELREKGRGFDVLGFIDKALSVGWTKKRIYNMLNVAQNDERAIFIIKKYLGM